MISRVGKKYLLQSPDMPDRVLYVRRWHNTALWCVGYLPMDCRERYYPNLDFDTGRMYHCLDPCRTAEEMQEKLDDYAKNHRLAVYQETEA